MRQKSANPSVKITITTSPKVKEYLERLVELGLYGNSVSEVGEQLICEQLREDLRKQRTALLSDK